MDENTRHPVDESGNRAALVPEMLRLKRETLAALDHRPAVAGLRPALTGKCVTFNVGAIRGINAA